MDQRIKLINDAKKYNHSIVKTLTVLILAGLLNPKYKYLHWKMVKLVGLNEYLDYWTYALVNSEAPQVAVIALCRKRINNGKA